MRPRGTPKRLGPIRSQRRPERRSLSGLSRQMLALARALRRRLMLVDEPTEGLSPLLVQNLVDALRRINGHGHYNCRPAEVALAISSYVYVMDQGQMEFEGLLPLNSQQTRVSSKMLLGVLMVVLGCSRGASGGVSP